MYLLDKNENILLSIHDFENDTYKRQILNEWSYSFEINSKYRNYIQRKNKVAFKDKDNNLQLFFIDSIDESIEGTIIANCLHDYYSLNDTIVEDKRAINSNCKDALIKLLEGSNYTAGDVEEFGEYDINFYFISRLEGLQNIIKTYGGELNFRYELSEDKKTIGKKIIDIKHRLGNDTGLRCCYDTNLETLKRNISSDNHFTVLYGRGKSLETENGGYTRKLTFDEVVWQTPNNPADKPLGQKYIEDSEAIKKWGRIEGRYENDKIEDNNILLENTWLKLQEVKDPAISYDAKIKDISNIPGFEHYKYELGDTIIIQNDDFGIVEARIVEENYSIKALENNEELDIDIVLGNLQKGITDNINSNLEDLNNKVDDNKDQINNESFPNELPAIPVLSLNKEGFASLSLSWSYEAKSYYTYILYASQIKDFNPTEDNVIYKGNGSSFWHQVNFGETWYYRVRVKNTHDKYTDFSNQVSGTTYKIKDGTTVFEDAAITDALIGTLKADRAWVGQFLGENIDARNIKVIDGNNKITFEVSSEGLVRIIQGLIEITEDGIRINLIDSENNILGYVLYDGQGVQVFTSEGDAISYFTREGSYIENLVATHIKCDEVIKIANKSGCSTKWHIASEATGDGTGRDANNKASSLKDVLRRIKNYGLYFTEEIIINVESGILNEDIIIQDFHGTKFTINIAKGVKINCEKFIMEDCTSRIYIAGETNEVLATDSNITSEEINARGKITSDSKLLDIINCSYVKITGLQLKSKNKGNAIGAWDASKILLADCDFKNFDKVAYTVYDANISICNCRGNANLLGYVSYGGELSSTQYIPKCEDSEIVQRYPSGIWHREETYVQLDSLQLEETITIPSTNKEESFKLTNIYTKVEGSGLTTSSRKDCTGQGKYKNYKNHRGYIELPTSEILEVLKTKINYTLKLRMTRLDSNHGYVGEVPHPVIRAVTLSGATNYWDSNVKFGRGVTKDIILSSEIKNAIINGATRLELFVDSNLDLQYSFYNDISLIIEGDNKDNISDTEVIVTGIVDTTIDGGIDLNVRESASATSNKLGTISNGSKVEIVEEINSWYKIKYGSGYGYVSSKYVVKETIKSEVIATAKITIANLNVRNGPGSSYNYVGIVREGDIVEIVEKDSSTGWYKIKYGSGYGYISGKSSYSEIISGSV